MTWNYTCKSLVLLGIFAALVLTACSSREKIEQREDVRLTIARDGDHIAVFVSNTGDSAVSINKLFRFDGVEPEVVFLLKDRSGAELEKAAGPFINFALPSKEERMIRLSPGELFGRAFSASDIARSFNLPGGACFQLRAEYQDKLFALDKTNPRFQSNAVELCTDKD